MLAYLTAFSEAAQLCKHGLSCAMLVLMSTQFIF
jgi:hypothetical protein